MRLPYVGSIPYKQSSMVATFKGLNQKIITSDGEFSDMKNISDDYYPAIASRKPRGAYSGIIEEPNGLIYKNGIFWVNGSQCFYEGAPIDGLTVSNGNKQLVGMGAYIYIFPDKIRFNTFDKTFENLELKIMFDGSWQYDDKVIDADDIGLETEDASSVIVDFSFTTGNYADILEATPGITIDRQKVIEPGSSGIVTADYRWSVSNGIYSVFGTIKYSFITSYLERTFNTAEETEEFLSDIGFTAPSLNDMKVIHVKYKNKGVPTVNVTPVPSSATATVDAYKMLDYFHPDTARQYTFINGVGSATFEPLSVGSAFIKATLSGAKGEMLLAAVNVSDNITISGCSDPALNGTKIITEKGNDYIAFVGVFTKTFDQTSTATLTKSGTSTVITTDNIGIFSVNDTVRISGCVDNNLNTTATVTAIGENSITVNKAVTATTTQAKGLHITLEAITGGTELVFERKVPDLDYVCENGNRLYGCNSKEHTVYASKLGDGLNWYNYENTAADAWYSNVGSDGDFTGCVAHMGYTLFMKENTIHVLYGAKPSNFSITEKQLKGIKKGCAESAVIINETLYYVGRDGVYAYDGSIPQKISETITEEIADAIGTQSKEKYYLSCKLNGKQTTLVYDLKTDIWDKEDDEIYECACYGEGYSFYITNNQLTSIEATEYNAPQVQMPSRAEVTQTDGTAMSATVDIDEFESGMADLGISLIEGEYEIRPGYMGYIKLDGETIYDDSNIDESELGITVTSYPGMLGYPIIFVRYYEPYYAYGIKMSGERDEVIEWFLESGDIVENSLDEKYISKLKFNFALDRGAEATIFIKCDDEAIWRNKGTIRSTKNTTYTIPIIPQRCNKFRYRIEGKGGFKLLGLSRYVEGGSEINGTR